MGRAMVRVHGLHEGTGAGSGEPSPVRMWAETTRANYQDCDPVVGSVRALPGNGQANQPDLQVRKGGETHMTPKRVIEIPRFQIRRIVGAIHVGKSDEYVRVQIRERATGAELARNRYRASRTPVQCHRANQKLYSAVRAGRL